MKRLLCVAAALALLLCGCAYTGEPVGKQVTGERFTSSAEALGMQVNDRKEDAPGEYETYLMAYSAEMTAEFMIVADEATSVQLYGSQKDNINQFYTEGDERSESRGKTYTKFTLRTQDNFYTLVRVERSVLLVSGTLNSIESAQQLLADIGY